MPAYLIVDTKISNAVEYENYKKLARPIAEKFGGVYRTRGGEMDVVETELWTPTRIVIVEFPNVKKAKDFLNSDEYTPVKAIRHAHAQCTAFIIEGV